MQKEDNTIDREYVLNKIESALEQRIREICIRLFEKGYGIETIQKEIEVHEKIMVYIKENLK